MKEKIKEIGERLDVTKYDIKELKKERLKEKIFYIIMGFAIAILLFATGYKYWLISSGNAGYPYAVAIPLLTKDKTSRGKMNPVIATILMILFTITLAGYLYMNLPKGYGVYYKERIEPSMIRRLVR